MAPQLTVVAAAEQTVKIMPGPTAAVAVVAVAAAVARTLQLQQLRVAVAWMKMTGQSRQGTQP